jgi:predicted ATPase
LKGKFKIANEDLNFETQDGQIIPKSLISFGMTNLGILQAVLGKNIINKGSFVFIDEPESNLHPEWQAILASVLVDLAKNGVYVIITTHSSDILKAFDVITQEKKIDKDLLTYYFNPNGTLLELHNKKYTAIDQARKELLKTYEKLLVRGYQL